MGYPDINIDEIEEEPIQAVQVGGARADAEERDDEQSDIDENAPPAKPVQDALFHLFIFHLYISTFRLDKKWYIANLSINKMRYVYFFRRGKTTNEYITSPRKRATAIYNRKKTMPGWFATFEAKTSK